MLASFVYALEPKISNFTMNPSDPDFGEEVMISFDLCIDEFTSKGMFVVAVSQYSSLQEFGTEGQVLVVSSAGVDVHILGDAMGSDFGYDGGAGPGTSDPKDCVPCAGGSATGWTKHFDFTITIPEQSRFNGCNITDLYIHVGTRNSMIDSSYWTALNATCQHYYHSWQIPVPAADYEIKKRADGFLNGDGSKLVYFVDYEYGNGQLTVTDQLPPDNVYRFLEAGPASYVTGAPSAGSTSGLITWTLPDMQGVPGKKQGELWFVVEQNGSLFNGMVINNTAAGAMPGIGNKDASVSITVGEPIIAVKKSQSVDNIYINETITYSLEYNINGLIMSAFRNFDNNAIGSYSVSPPSGWKFKPFSGNNGTWTVSDACTTGDRIITGDVEGTNLYPALLVDDGSGLDDSDQFCTGVIETEVYIDPGGYDGSDASVQIRVNDQTGVDAVSYALILSIDGYIGTADGHIAFQKCAFDTCDWPAASMSPDIRPNTWYKIKILADKNGDDYIFSAKVWEKGGPEPGSWSLTWSHAGGAVDFDYMC